MCGFAGFLIDDSDASIVSSLGKEQRSDLLAAMGEAIAHRGPDQKDEWLSADQQLGFAHRRLSIIDLSAAGQQPMVSQCGRYVMVYNGMVYNYQDISRELTAENITLRGSSDTEVIVEAVALWGFEATLQKLHGMFAIALYDNETGDLSFARDRMGEKPVFIGSHNGHIVFASELKALQALFSFSVPIGVGDEVARPPLKPQLNRKAIGLYLRHGYIPAPYSIYQTIFKLPPASMVTISREQRTALINEPQTWLELFEQYWSLTSAGEDPLKPSSTNQQQNTFEELLDTVIQREMHADVPLGAFLSGGVDSSTIVSVMQKLSQQSGKGSVLTFSIGFEQEQFNEAPFAAAVAEHLGTQHFEQIVTARDAQDVIPHLAKMYDEPFADSSQIPTFLVSKLAREHVTVSLSGDGGDELFGGYERYDWAQKIWQQVSWMPIHARKIVAALLRLLSTLNNSVVSSNSPGKVQNLIAKFQRLSAMLSSENRQFFYRTLISAGVNADQYVLDIDESEPAIDFLSQMQLENNEFIHQMMYLDIHSYLPGDILTKVDRASMAVSLESRVPLLDHAIVEQAWLMREQTLDRRQPAKQALRKTLYQSVPKTLIERPKKGFAIPLAEWLRGDLCSWAEALLDRERLADEGVFDADKIASMWSSFKKGKAGAEHLLWSILMFQCWYQEWYR